MSTLSGGSRVIKRGQVKLNGSAPGAPGVRAGAPAARLVRATADSCVLRVDCACGCVIEIECDIEPSANRAEQSQKQELQKP